MPASIVALQSSGVTALNRTNGEVLWTRVGGPPFAVVSDESAGRLGIAQPGNFLVVDRASSGAPAWSRRVRTPIRAISLGKQAVVTADGDGRLCAFEADGTARWSVDGVRGEEWISLGQHGDLVVVGSGELQAYRLADGAPVWRTVSAERPGFYDAKPVERDGILFVSGWGVAHAVGLADGHVLWKHKFERQDNIGRALLVDDSLVCAPLFDAPGFVECLSMSDGSRRFRFDFDDHPSVEPMLIGASVLVAGDEHVYGLDSRTGSLRWTRRFNNVATMVEAPGGLVVSDLDGVYLLDAVSGNVLAERKAPKMRVSLCREGILFACADAEVAAVRASDLTTVWSVRVPKPEPKWRHLFLLG